VDKESKYLTNGFPYVGKDETRSANQRVSGHVVMQLLCLLSIKEEMQQLIIIVLQWNYSLN